MVDMPQSSFFTEVGIPQQKPYSGDGVTFPTVLSLNPNFNTQPSLLHFTQQIIAHKPWLDSHLHRTGAILFRGFPVISASDFNDVVEAFGFDELPYVGGAAPRTNVVGRVFTANESPPDQKIPFHHEMAQVYNPFLPHVQLYNFLCFNPNNKHLVDHDFAIHLLWYPSAVYN